MSSHTTGESADREAATVPLAWWLVPSGEAARRWQARIRSLAARVGGPVFEPHLTLAMSRLPQEVDPRPLAAALQQALLPLWLQAGSVGHGPAYFQSIFLRLQSLPESPHGLPQQVARLAAVLDGLWDSRTAAPTFPPHLSLFYGELPEARRAALAAEIEPEQAPVCFDTLVAVRPAPGRTSLADVADWDAFLRLSLANTSPLPQKQG